MARALVVARVLARAHPGGRHAKAEEVEGGLAGAAGARRQGRRQELHDRGEGVDDLEVPPGPPGDEDLGLLVGQPAGGLALPRADDCGDQAAQRHRGHVGDDRVAQRARQRVPAQRSDPVRGRHARAAGPDRHAPAWRRESSSVRRDAAAVVHQGRRKGPALHHEHVHVLQRAARQHGLVSRPRGRQHAHERLCRARGARTSSATTRTRASPAIRSGCPPARTRSRSCCRTRRSTPTGACSTRRRA